MKLKEWVKGEGDHPARVDPKMAALVTTVADLVVTLGLNDQINLPAQQVLPLLLHIAAVLTILRSIQLSAKASKKPAD